MFQSCGKEETTIQLHDMQNMIVMLICWRWCLVSASQSWFNWFHTCLYHIINESTRRKTAVASDRLRHAGQHWRKKVREILYFFPLPLISSGIRVGLSPRILFSRLCDCDPYGTSVMLWKLQWVLFVLTAQFFQTPFDTTIIHFVLEKISNQCWYLTLESNLNKY